MNLTEILREEDWFQGRPNGTGYGIGHTCLMLGLERMHGASYKDDFRLCAPQVKLVADIAARLFPERVPAWAIPWSRGVEFNNHPETTFADVMKVAREYDLESDLHA